MVSTPEPARAPWDRREGESARQYEAFRFFRDLGPLRALGDVLIGPSYATVTRWAVRWDWKARAVAWDDEVHRAEDAHRLEAIRTMHADHRAAGRAARAKALEALAMLDASEVTAAGAARLLDLGTRLERATLTTSVEELQGLGPHDPTSDDPWDRIARELAGDGGD